MKSGSGEFVSLESVSLRDALVDLLQVEPLKKISIRVLTFPRHTHDPNGGKQYELLFAKVAGFRITSLHLPARVQTHALTSKSSFIEEVRANSNRNSAGIDLLRLHHYQLTTEEGQIDVASEIAVCLPIWEP
jgi:hypothetical protein